VPERLRVLGRQRERWHRGLADVLWRHRSLILNPRYGAMGMIAVPYFVLIELLALVVELIGLVAVAIGLVLGAVNVGFAILFLLVAYGFGIALTTDTMALDKWTYRSYGGLPQRVWLLLVSLFEGLGYRQLTAVWRLRGLIRHARGSREWGAMTREGFSSQQAAETPPQIGP
jgi:cellulose synthase/poly-beta-1,6-N-acetylglucosamine synthase-like glycosyltransferase